MIALRVQCDECPRHCDIPLTADSAGRINGGMFESGAAARVAEHPEAIAAVEGKPWIELDVTELLPEGWHVEERGTYPSVVYIRCADHAP